MNDRVEAGLNGVFCRTLVDEWARAGVGIAVLSPGSRSAPLALALASQSRIPVHVVLDERSAAFFALGAAKASGRPSIVLTTSGTAAANLHPAVLEAHHARTPLIVCTADRPPELRDTGAGQATDQIKLFGDAVRWFVEAGVPVGGPNSGRYWRSLAGRAAAAAAGPPAGPVHLNLAFAEPLVDVDSDGGGPGAAVAPGRRDGAPWVEAPARRPTPHPSDVSRLHQVVESAERGALVAGWGAGVDAAVVERFAVAAGWPVLADGVSGARAGTHAISTYDPLLRVPGFAEAHRPDVVVQVGAALTGRVGAGWPDPSVPRLLVDPDNAWLDPQRSASERLVADPQALLEATADLLHEVRKSDWLEEWLRSESSARDVIDELLDSWDSPFEGRVARDAVASLPDGATLVVGSSMPVRDIESFAAPRSGLRFLSNRGVNGIDGTVSTVLGAATVAAAPVAALIGDLTFLHDAGGLSAARDVGTGHGVVFVVVDNNGGGVFSFLEQARLPDHFERLFGTPHNLDLVAVAKAYGVGARTVDRAPELPGAITEALAEGGVHVIVVRTDRAENVDRHRQAWQAVASAL